LASVNWGRGKERPAPPSPEHITYLLSRAIQALSFSLRCLFRGKTGVWKKQQEFRDQSMILSTDPCWRPSLISRWTKHFVTGEQWLWSQQIWVQTEAL